MKLEVITKHEYKKNNFGKWNLIEESTQIFESNEKIDSFLKCFFSWNMSMFGAREKTIKNYTCYGYAPIKHYNTLGNERFVTEFKYTIK